MAPLIWLIRKHMYPRCEYGPALHIYTYISSNTRAVRPGEWQIDMMNLPAAGGWTAENPATDRHLDICTYVRLSEEVESKWPFIKLTNKFKATDLPEPPSGDLKNVFECFGLEFSIGQSSPVRRDFGSSPLLTSLRQSIHIQWTTWATYPHQEQ